MKILLGPIYSPRWLDPRSKRGQEGQQQKQLSANDRC
jgi:hypothetical protein